jgi:hypothetical protein
MSFEAETVPDFDAALTHTATERRRTAVQLILVVADRGVCGVCSFRGIAT